ncbi:MAG: 6,7-dimethyl-8-ribityllumazine synthase [Burkholderiales bacterium]|nr:6,7-dimethyl-8-ribityllumazine synthase [Burkholderiales bacterium]
MAKFENIEEIEQDLDGHGLRIGIVMSRFNIDVCEGLLSGCVSSLTHHGVAPSDMILVTVPGALEIPVALGKLARSGKYDALVALGAVIRGETYHFEVVSNESARGVMEVQLDTGVPVANGILTTEDDDQALYRMNQKGGEAGLAAIEMANLLRRMP